MLLLPNFRLPTLIHTRSANAKWLYELSHRNPVWLHPSDAERLGVATGDLVRVDTEIGHLVDRVWITEGLAPGVLALSHHLGRWRLKDGDGVNPSASSLVRLERPSEGVWRIRIVKGRAYESFDPDTSASGGTTWGCTRT
jgi:anaerobic selenocysteine-containing dehydrogenase